jgi:uncharacterized protein (DUF1800 family)
MFGAAQADILYFQKRSMQQAVDELLEINEPAPPPPLKDYGKKEVVDTHIPDGKTWVNDSSSDFPVMKYRRDSFNRWWIGLILNQKRNVREKLTLFWHNHFSTSAETIGYPECIYRHHKLLRSSCLGNFKTLVRNVTIDPGMLIFLNGNTNTRNAPNENFARELQELFTLGKENHPNYTEADVKITSRVLTGWTVKLENLFEPYFHPPFHDPGSKSFSSFYGNKVIAGRNGLNAGNQELDDLVDMIFLKKKEISIFIVKKIYQWFCYHTIDAETQQKVIAPLATLFIESNWEIKPVLSALLKSAHFYDLSKRGCLIKSPIDLVAGLFREFDFNFNAVNDLLDELYGLYDYVYTQVAAMNQVLSDPPEVAGWPSYYQQPLYHKLWINADTLGKRKDFIDEIVHIRYTSRRGDLVKLDPVRFAATFPDPGNADKLLKDILQNLFTIPFTETSRQQIKQNILFSKGDQDVLWTSNWNKWKLQQRDQQAYEWINARLVRLFNYLLNLPEYQLS